MPATDITFSSHHLLARLEGFPPAKRFIVGFSGGADSTALLHALHRLQPEPGVHIEACHFNHGLNSESDAWQQHCQAFCADRGIPFTAINLDLSGDLSNLENSARDLRYKWVAGHLDADTAYLTAHHADDRVETFLLNALRGSGLDGVGSIPPMRTLGPGLVIRPLLDFPRSALVCYLQSHGVDWIEDPSNQNSVPDRNFIRNEVMLLLESRWPAARSSLARTSTHLRNAGMALKWLLEQRAGLAGFDSYRLPVKILDVPVPGAPGLVLREWLRGYEAPSVPEARLLEFLDQLRAAAPGSRCTLAWEGWTLRLYQDALYLAEPGEPGDCPALDWNEGVMLQLGDAAGVLEITGDNPEIGINWRVGPRRAGIRMALHSGGPGRKLKSVLREQNIPPWLRMSVPILYQGDEIMAIGDWHLSPDFQQWLDKKQLGYCWRPRRAELCSLRAQCHGHEWHDHLA